MTDFDRNHHNSDKYHATSLTCDSACSSVNMADPAQSHSLYNNRTESAYNSVVENHQLLFSDPFNTTAGAVADTGSWNVSGDRKYAEVISKDNSWGHSCDTDEVGQDAQQDHHGERGHHALQSTTAEDTQVGTNAADKLTPTPTTTDNAPLPLTNADTSTAATVTADTSTAAPVTADTSTAAPVTADASTAAPVTADTSTPAPVIAETSTPAPVTADIASTGITTNGELAFYGSAPAGDPSAAEQVSATLGRPVAVTTFLNQNQDEQATTSWTVGQYSSWQAANPGTPISLGVPLTFENQTVQQTASGANDQEFVDVAQQLVNAGMGNASIRLGEEMNGTWYPWGGDPTDFVSAYNDAAEAMKSVPGANFNFVWNPNNLSSGPYPFQDYYPGGANVNTIGVDAYDNRGDGGASEINGTGGLQDILTFAEQQGKAFAVPEWGLTNSSGDDSAYINAMANFFKTVPDLSFQGYYGDGSTTPVLSANPQSQAAYNADFTA